MVPAADWLGTLEVKSVASQADGDGVPGRGPRRTLDSRATAGRSFKTVRFIFVLTHKVMIEPYCLAMVLCDYVYRDPTTNKHTILGTFSTITAPRYPTRVQFYVYFAITDGLDEADIQIRLVDSEEAFSDNPTEVMSVGAKIAFPSPLAVVEGVLGVGFELRKEGVYHCELRCSDSVLMSRRLLAATAPGNPSETEHQDG